MKKAWGVETSARASASWLVAVLALVFLPVASFAGVLGDDRADMLYHRYEGGGVTIHGPSLLVRKKFAEKYAISANYYQDYVTSASIDVEVSGASQYKEERDQYSLGLEYLRGKTTYSLNYTDSKENDYTAQDDHVRHQPGPVRRPDHDHPWASRAATTSCNAATRSPTRSTRRSRSRPIAGAIASACRRS
jgi:hypothetical protein